MQSTGNLQNIEQAIAVIFAQYPLIPPIIQAIYKEGGSAYLVGGAVRDLYLGLPIHDLDIEVHNLTLDQLAAILSTISPVNYVGKSFGVLKLPGVPIDWALPRTDLAGRKPQVFLDPSLKIEEALRRRDVTMNAMAIELSTGKWIDPFGGRADIDQGLLRSPDLSFFSEDPLRFYRVMQFIGRFSMKPDLALESLCSRMDISQISVERIEVEFEKLFLLSKCPSLGLRWLFNLGRLAEILPELAHTHSIKQEPHWHPEGDVFEHLMQSVDAAAQIEGTSEERLILIYAALCHDLGKVSTSIMVEGKIKSPGHAEASVPLARRLLKRISSHKKLIETVSLLVKYHMVPGQFIKQDSGPSAYRRLAIKLSKYTNIEMLARLALADRRGRNGEGHCPLTTTPHFLGEFLRRAHDAQALSRPEQILHGRDIQDVVPAGPTMGALLAYAYELQIEEGITQKEILRARVLEKYKSEHA